MGGRIEQCFSFCPERRDRSISKDRALDSISISWRNCFAHPSQLESRKHSPRNSLAMQQLLVIGHSLNGVTDRMAEVQNHPQAGFSFVYANNVSLHANGSRDDIFESFTVAAKNGITVAFHKTKEACIAN